MAGKLSKLFKKEALWPSQKKEEFWFETTDEALLQPGDVMCDSDNLFVYVYKAVEKDKNGQDCEIVDIKFFPYLLNKRKKIISNIITWQETNVDIKGGNVVISKIPEELKAYKKQKNSLHVVNYMGFVTEYFDYMQAAFPNNDMKKCLNCRFVREKYNISTNDFIKICEKTEVEFKKSEQKRLKGKQDQAAKKTKKKEGTPNF